MSVSGASNERSGRAVHLEGWASGYLEGEGRDLGGAVEAEGKAYSSDAAVDVELHAAEPVRAFSVDAAHGRKDEGAEDGKADLAAMGVAGEHEVDQGAARVSDDVVGEVGGVDHEEDRSLRVGGDAGVEVGDIGTGVGGAGDGEVIAALGEDEEAVPENGDAVLLEGAGDEGGADSHVVVAEDGVLLRAVEGSEDLGAAAGGVVGGDEGEGAAGDEVSGEEDEVGGEGVDARDDLLEEVGLGVLVEVDVAELGDAQAVKGCGEIADGDGVVGGVDLVAGDLTGVDGEAGGEGSGTGEEGSAGDGRGGRRRAYWHGSIIRGGGEGQGRRGETRQRDKAEGKEEGQGRRAR